MPPRATAAFASCVRAAAAIAARARRAPLGVAGAVLALVVLLVMGRLLFGHRALVLDDIFTSDLLNNNVPPRAFLGDELRAGRFPLWTPGIFGGLPTLAQGEAAAANPITWVVYGLFDWVTATNLSIALHTWIAGFGMVLLARRFGAGLAGALTAGIAFMFCGFLVAHVKHMNLHHAAAWTPLLLHAADRLRERPELRRALPLGAVAALELTEGHPQVCYIGAFLLVPLLALRFATRGPRRARTLRYWLSFAVAGTAAVAVMILLAGAYLYAGAELAAMSERSAQNADGGWAFATRFKFLPQNLVTIVSAYALGDASNISYAPKYGIFWESWLYLGVLPVVAAVVALLVAVRRARRRHFELLVVALSVLLLSGLAVGLMLGGDSPIFKAAFRVVPGMRLFRFPHRFGLMIELGLLLLAALGVNAVVRAAGRSFGRRFGAVLGALVVAITAADFVGVMRRQFVGARASDLADPPRTVAVLREHAPPTPWRFYSIFAPEAHVEAFYRARGWNRRLSPYVDQRAHLQPSTNLLWGVESIHGYTSMVPYDVGAVMGSHTIPGIIDSRMTHTAEPAPGCEKKGPTRYNGECAARLRCRPELARALGAFNVAFVVSSLEVAACDGLELVEAVPSGMFKAWVYANKRVLPRAYVVGTAVDVPNAREAGRRMVRRDFAPERMVLRVGAPASAPKGRAAPFRACTYERGSSGDVVVGCDLATPGFLVVADTRYPGQRVTVDGAPVETFSANGFLVGVPLEAGAHRIEVSYRPWHARFVFVSMAAWALLVGGAILGAVRRWRRAPR